VGQAQTFYDRVVVGEFGPDGKPNYYFQPTHTFEVVFGNMPDAKTGKSSAIAGRNLEVLEDMYTYVSTEVMPRFASFLT